MMLSCIAWLQPHRVFFLLSMLFGMAYLVVTPPFRAPDETGHYMRVLAYANGVRWSDYEGRKAYLDFFHAATAISDVAAKQLPDDRDKAVLYTRKTLEPVLTAGQTPEAEKLITMQSRGPTVALYSPVAYFPAIISTVVLDAMHVSPAVIFYTMRLLLLLSSNLLIAWAIKRIPYAPWAITAGMLWPVAAWGRGMVTADSMTVAFAVAWVAMVLGKMKEGGKWRYLLLLLALALAISLSKIIFVILLLLLVIPRVFKSWHLLIALVATAAALMWNVQAGEVLQAEIEHGTLLVSNPAAQVALLKDNPLRFVAALRDSIATIHFWLVEFGKSAVGIIGTLNIHLPVWVCILVVVGTFSLLFLRSEEATVPSWWTRLIAITIVGGCFVGTMLALYVQWSPVDSPTVIGFQGRYLLPVLPLLMIALMPPRGARVPAYVLPLLALLIGIAGNTSGVVAMVQTSYYGQ